MLAAETGVVTGGAASHATAETSCPHRPGAAEDNDEASPDAAAPSPLTPELASNWKWRWLRALNPVESGENRDVGDAKGERGAPARNPPTAAASRLAEAAAAEVAVPAVAEACDQAAAASKRPR